MLWQDRAVLPAVQILIRLICDTFRYVGLMFRSTQSVKAENLFLRRQLALYVERGVNPRRVDTATRIFPRLVVAILSLAERPGGSSTRDADPLAPSRLEAVLAPEVSTRPSADSPTTAGANSPDGE